MDVKNSEGAHVGRRRIARIAVADLAGVRGYVDEFVRQLTHPPLLVHSYCYGSDECTLLGDRSFLVERTGERLLRQ